MAKVQIHQTLTNQRCIVKSWVTTKINGKEMCNQQAMGRSDIIKKKLLSLNEARMENKKE